MQPVLVRGQRICRRAAEVAGRRGLTAPVGGQEGDSPDLSLMT